MPTYIDESGDTGRVALGGKPYFRLAAVWTPTDDKVKAFQEALSGLKRDLNLRADYEFRYSRITSHDIKAAFFALALDHEFYFAFSQIDKTQKPWDRAGRDEQYQCCVTDLAVALRPAYESQESNFGRPLKERVLVDDNDSKGFLDIVKEKFIGLKSRNLPSKSFVKTVDFRKSHKEPWLQLADMTCGAMGSFIDGSDPRYHALISEREVNALTRL